LKKLDAFAQIHPGKPISSYAVALFPELVREEPAPEKPREPLPLPTAAPAIWPKDKLPLEKAVDFIRRVYAPWIGNGLTRVSLGHLDPRLYAAFEGWVSRNGVPADLNLPTQREVTDRWVAQVVSGDTGVSDASEKSRLANALYYRRHQTSR